MGILAICLVVIPSKEELFSEGIKKAVSNDLVDISIPPAKITGEEGKRKILYTVIVDNKSEYLMRDLKVYIRPEEMVRQNLLPYENEEYLMILGIAVSFVSITVAWIVIGVSILQMFIFYRCPHCNYGLYNVRGIPSCCPNCGEDL